MIPNGATLRIARPTDNLPTVKAQYMNGLGFRLLGEFSDHAGFDGVMLGHELHPYHLEFTHHKGTQVGKAPTQDNLLIFYIPAKDAWLAACDSLQKAGFIGVRAYNPYWDIQGKTFEDIDGYRVVLQQA